MARVWTEMIARVDLAVVAAKDLIRLGGKSAGQAQRFLSAHAMIYAIFGHGVTCWRLPAIGTLARKPSGSGNRRSARTSQREA
jgi:hypothetical protein